MVETIDLEGDMACDVQLMSQLTRLMIRNYCGDCGDYVDQYQAETWPNMGVTHVRLRRAKNGLNDRE